MAIDKIALTNKCTGCSACFNSCPTSAIEMVADKEGFLRPRIDSQKCINCKRCESVCYALCKEKNLRIDATFKQEVYAGWSKSNKTRRKSTSGGAFCELAKSILRAGGIVYGAGFDNCNHVKHQRVDRLDSLYLLQGSKYVQSEIGNIFASVKKDLRWKCKVLFSGTPCQIKALLLYLGDTPTENLITVDLVCHGVPSPKIFNDYLNYLESKFNSHITNKEIYFRDKKYSWAEFNMLIKFENGKEYISMSHEDPYLRGFLREYYLRPSCHVCDFANPDRPSDITLGDYWGYQSTCMKDYDDDRGISLMVLNTKKAVEFVNTIKTFYFYKRDIENAINTTITFQKPFEPNAKRDLFWDDYNLNGFNYVLQKYLFPEEMSTWAKAKMQSRRLRAKVVYAMKCLFKR